MEKKYVFRYGTLLVNNNTSKFSEMKGDYENIL